MAIARRSTDTEISAESHDPEVRRRQIVARSAELFNERGYHRVSMNDIAEGVGLAKPTLYHYFKSKAEILYWIHEEFFDPALAFAEAQDVSDPARALREIMKDILGLMGSHPAHLRVVFEHHRELVEPQQDLVREKRDRYDQIVQSFVDKGIKDGVFRNVDARLTTLAVFGMCNWAYQWYTPGARSTEEIGDFFADLLLDGLVAD